MRRARSSGGGAPEPGRPPIHAILLALWVTGPAVAFAQEPATQPAEDTTAEPPASAEAAAEPTAASAPPQRIPVVGYALEGTRIDSDESLHQLLVSVVPIGEPFVPAGPSDEIGKPLGTIPRLVQTLDAVGYRAVITTKAAGGGFVLVVNLLAYERVRYIFVSGNWPVRQDEIQRRITIRPGRPLPPAGPERVAALERERGRVIDYLRSQGYFEANVRLEAKLGLTSPGATDLYVRIDRGPSYPLGPIAFTGNTVLSADEMDPTFRHKDWLTLWTKPDAFTQKQLRADLDALESRYRELGYLGVRITSDFSVQKSVDRLSKNVRLKIHVNERKRVVVAFEGNAHESSASLRDELTLLSRGSYDDYEVGVSADAIQRHYQARGYFFARVDWRRERLSADEERVVFVIDEGPRLKVRGIEFVGNKAVPSKELAGVVTVRTYPFLGLGSGGYVTGKQMEQDVERLVEHYRGKGYLEAKARAEAATSRESLGQLGAVAAAADSVSRDADALYVRFTIEEGALLLLAAEDFRSADGTPLPYTKEFLLETVSLRPGEPYTPPLVRDDGRRIERLLGDAGYPASVADPEVNRTGDKVTLTWVLKLGPRVRIGPVFVRGNFKTQPHAILEQIPLASGGYLTTTGMERGQRNLGFLQLFNNATPISFPGKDESRPVVPMVVEVEERHQQYSVVHVGAGASTDQRPPEPIRIGSLSLPIGFFGRVGYDNRNWFGQGWNLLTEAIYGTSLFRANARFLDRRFFGTFFRFDASLSYLSQATIRLGDIRSGGGSVGFARELYPGVDAGLHYNLRNTTHTEPFIRGAGPDSTITHVRLGTTVGSISANLEWVRMDNRLLPTRGFRVDTFAELAVPALSAPLRSLPIDIGDDSFLKVGVRTLSVVPIGRHLFLRLGFRLDHGFPLGGASLLPKVERYFAGGDVTIRGFQLDRARTEVVRQISNPAVDLYEIEYRPLGGNLRILQNIDLQFPISPPWYGSIFLDNGVVADSLDGLGARKFRHGVGVSPLLIRLPIGDISLAWAWPLDPGPGDTKIGVFHVNVGLMF